jgi:large subunit ribosomal protein L24
MKVKKNDTVLVITGKDAGKTAKVLAAMPKTNKVVVEGINMQKKSKKARSAQEVSQIVEQAGPINASNVLVVCPVCGKATRVAYKVEGDKKVRVCKKCNAVLDGAKEVKEVKKETKTSTAKKTTAKKTTTKKTTKKADAEAPAENN